MHFVPKIKIAGTKILPIEIKLAHTDMFDNRVLFIYADSPLLITLHNDLMQLLPDQIRAQYTGRKFQPHVTLAQAKPKQNLSPELIAKFKHRIDPLLPQTFTATQLTEFKWLRPHTYRLKDI